MGFRDQFDDYTLLDRESCKGDFLGWVSVSSAWVFRGVRVSVGFQGEDSLGASNLQLPGTDPSILVIDIWNLRLNSTVVAAPCLRGPTVAFTLLYNQILNQNRPCFQFYCV